MSYGVDLPYLFDRHVSYTGSDPDFLEGGAKVTSCAQSDEIELISTSSS